MGIFRKQGVYWINYHFQGKRRRERIGPSRSLAKEVLAKRRVEIAEGRFFPERREVVPSFAEFMAKYWERHWQHLEWKGADSMRDYLLRSFKDKRLDQIRGGDVQDFYNSKAQQTSVATANRYLARLANLFAKARQWQDYLGADPTRAVDKRREENHRIRFLSCEEIGWLLSVCDERIRPILIVALFTGMRKGELLNLRWENIDLENGVLYVLKSKSGKPREIPLASQVKEVLISLGPQRDGLVFEIPEITLRRCFDRALTAAGISAFRFHDLRHTFASHFVMRTGDLPVLQQLLGHSSLKMTMRYAHLAKNHVASSMQLFASGMRVNSGQLLLERGTKTDTKPDQGDSTESKSSDKISTMGL